MHNHTPGPWGHRPSSGKLHIDPIHRDGFESVTSGRDFFEVYVSGQDHTERLANAALIAAAPDLLRALKRAHWMLAEIHAGNTFSEAAMWAEIEQAGAALRRAEAWIDAH